MIKLKRRHFDTTEVMEAESQMVLKTLTEHDFQDAFKNGTSTRKGACAWKGTTSRMMVASRRKASSDQTAAPVPEIMDGSSIVSFTQNDT
jgi:hypothetical protein